MIASLMYAVFDMDGHLAASMTLLQQTSLSVRMNELVNTVSLLPKATFQFLSSLQALWLTIGSV